MYIPTKHLCVSIMCFNEKLQKNDHLLITVSIHSRILIDIYPKRAGYEGYGGGGGDGGDGGA